MQRVLAWLGSWLSSSALITDQHTAHPETTHRECAPSGATPYPAVCDTPRRQEIHEALERHAALLAELYVAALTLLENDQFPSRLRLISHAVREICNGLPEAIAGPVQSPVRVQYVNDLDDIAADWKRYGLPPDPITGTPVPGQQTTVVPVPRPVVLRLVALVRSHIASRETAPDAARRLYEAASGHSFGVTLSQWRDVREWFVGHAHESRGRGSPVSTAELRRQFEMFEAMLGALLRGFFASTAELDAILDATNS